MTAVTRAAEAPRAASSMSSSSTRCSWTGGAKGWMRKTSRSRQLDCSCTSRQSLANRCSRTGSSGSPSSRQISAASSGWALPLKTAISRTLIKAMASPPPGPGRPAARGLPRGLPGSLRPVGRGLVRREVEALADLLLDLLLAGTGVDGDHVFLAREQLQHRVGLLVVVTQPHRERLLGVVLALDQGAAADVADAFLRRAGGDEVVVQAAARAQPAGEHPPADLGVGQVQVDHAVDVVALQEELRLAAAAGEAVDDEPVVPVVLAEPLGGYRLRHVVADQFPRRHDPPDLSAELGVLLHVPAEDVADADVDQVQVHREYARLGTLAAALDTHDDVFAHTATLAQAGIRRRVLAWPPLPAQA